MITETVLPHPLQSLPEQTSVGNHFIANYPPFSCWTPDELPNFDKALHRPAKPGSPLGLYVHLPFCRQRCHYCYFRVYPRSSREDVDAYTQAVLRELALYRSAPALKDRAFTSVYFGGGSPAYLEVDQINRLLGGLQEQAPWDDVEECTFECEPGAVTPEKFAALKRLGVTRLSIGFQSLDNDVLRRSGRNVTVEQCLRAFSQARDAGFDEINIDLLAGLPGETSSTWRRSVEQVIALAPECITMYQLELTYNSALYASIRAGRSVPLASWPVKEHWVDEGLRMCEEAGYVIASGYAAIRHPESWRFSYTVEHFWKGTDLLALGESSFGHMQGVHYQNLDRFDQYLAAIEAGRRPVRRALAVSAEERLRREVILLLKTGSLEPEYFQRKFGIDLRSHFRDEFEWLASNHCLVMDDERIRLTREALLRVDWLLPLFYLPQHRNVRYT